MNERGAVMLVDDDADLLDLLNLRLTREGFAVTTAASGKEAMGMLASARPNVVVTDLRMDDTDGMALLAHLQRELPALPVIIITAHGTIPDAVRAAHSGAFAFMTKPVARDELCRELDRAIALYGAQDNAVSGGEIITRSARMEALLADARRAAATDVAILIQGPTGTGKDVLARFVHDASPRRNSQLVAVNCGAIAESLFESELFGHAKGAFTGAVAERKGLIAAADRGTLFLDEVGELPLPMQVKLLRVLEDHEVRPVGRTSSQPVDIRVVAATNRDLQTAVADGVFREDLFYRLNVVELKLPPLEERREDIALIANHLLSRLSSATGTPKVFAPEAMALLVAASWPGNVRQLQNVVQRNAALAPSPIISAEQVRQSLGDDAPASVPSFDEARDEFIRQYLVQLLQISDGNVTRAARLAKRNRTDFYKLLQRHGIER
jgi:two-component system, NtrC family, response regulator GlrR